MDRDDFDELACDLLGRPLEAAEYRDISAAADALRLKSGSPIAVLLVLFQALRTQMAEAKVTSSRSRRALGVALGVILGAACIFLGYATAARQILRDLDPAVRWTLSEDGKRARRMSDSGLLEMLDACSIPGWRLEPPGCFPGPDPASGQIQGLRTRPDH